ANCWNCVDPSRLNAGHRVFLVGATHVHGRSFSRRPRDNGPHPPRADRTILYRRWHLSVEPTQTNFKLTSGYRLRAFVTITEGGTFSSAASTAARTIAAARARLHG